MQLLRTEAWWPYALIAGLVVAVSLAIHAHRSSVHVVTSRGRQLALTERSAGVLRWRADGGWQLELGDATPSGGLHAMGQTQVTGLDALNVLQRLISLRLPDGASDLDLTRAEAMLVERGNPFLSQERRTRWGDVLPVNALCAPEQLALELAAHEAIADHQLRARGRTLEERFMVESDVARIVREELD